jgi:hypothetical protein
MLSDIDIELNWMLQLGSGLTHLSFLLLEDECSVTLKHSPLGLISIL